jgi:hypothetical protein
MSCHFTISQVKKVLSRLYFDVKLLYPRKASTEVIFDFRQNTEFFEQYTEFREITCIFAHKIPYALYGLTQFPRRVKHDNKKFVEEIELSSLQRPELHLDGHVWTTGP